MAATASIDWIRTTTQVKHYGNLMYDTAVRTGWVTGLDGDNNDDGDAIAALASSIGSYHHNNVKLPLASIRSRKVGPTKCLVDATYGHGPWSIPLRSSLDMAQPADSVIQRQWWQREIDESGDPDFDGTTGLPDGPANYRVYKQTGSYAVSFEPYARAIGVTTWRVPFLLADDPTTLVTVPKMRLNSDSFTIKSACNAKTLAYLGLVYQPVDTPNGVRYAGEYRFLYREETHIKQYVFLVADLTHTSFPLVRNVQEHPATAFTKQFPMNRGAWATSTDYIVGDTVWSDETPTKPYKCKSAHTSSAMNKPPTGTDEWEAL